MLGIDLNRPIVYKHASMRYFEENEAHVERLCRDDVLLLVFDGVLRFWEDGVPWEVAAGAYHIQKQGSYQQAPEVSDSPRYLYVHFLGDWADTGQVLPADGVFDRTRMQPLMELLDRLAHEGATVTEQVSVFTEILSRLYRGDRQETQTGRMAAFLRAHLGENISLERLSEEFHFSKNHIINLFRQVYGTTPTEYLNTLRLQKARHLLEATSAPAEAVAVTCGFRNYSHFYRLFRRHTGVSPTQWRQQKRLEP